MFDNFGCLLEKCALDEFILIMTNQNVKNEDEFLKFDLLEIYQHLLNCDIHNRFFVEYIDNMNRLNKNPHILTENIKYLSEYLKKDENSTTN